MTNIQSQTVSLNTSTNEIFNFLSDLNNYNQLLPSNNISDFKSTSDSCSFKVQGAYHIGLIKMDAQSPNKIVLNSSESSPIKFNLTIYINEQEGKSSTYLDCETSLNPMLKMMIEKPLKNLFDYMANRLLEIKG